LIIPQHAHAEDSTETTAENLEQFICVCLSLLDSASAHLSALNLSSVAASCIGKVIAATGDSDIKFEVLRVLLLPLPHLTREQAYRSLLVVWSFSAEAQSTVLSDLLSSVSFPPFFDDLRILSSLTESANGVVA
jgi:hypothetical protein